MIKDFNETPLCAKELNLGNTSALVTEAKATVFRNSFHLARNPQIKRHITGGDGSQGSIICPWRLQILFIEIHQMPS